MTPTPAYDGFAIDLDGVVWLSHEPIPGSIAAIGRLRAAGHPLVFVTNDPRSTRDQLAERLRGLGAPTDPTEVLTSASATAAAIARVRPGAAVLTVGTEALRSELAAAGLDAHAATEAAAAGLAAAPFAVVVGGGDFDQDLLRIASGAVRDGAELWATNKDPTYPTPAGLVPGTGAIVAALEVASGVEARLVGKPEPALFEAALERLAGERPLMAGDSLHSDIAGAAGAGLATALILSGRDSRADAAAANERPDHIFDDLAALADALA